MLLLSDFGCVRGFTESLTSVGVVCFLCLRMFGIGRVANRQSIPFMCGALASAGASKDAGVLLTSQSRALFLHVVLSLQINETDSIVACRYSVVC